ncbi:MAG: hypothetical protein KBA95_18565 [Acidobacteria bacterium]|nr:hypothetical protein [Acidobacteriota bacterium]
MALLTLDACRALIETDRTDAELSAIIDREESALVRKLGPHGDGITPVTATIYPVGGALFLPRPAVSVTSVGGVAWAATGLTLVAGEGRIAGGAWSAGVLVVYVPADDRDERTAALIDLVRLTLERRAMKGESVAGEHSYSAPQSWEAERASIYRRLIYASM